MDAHHHHHPGHAHPPATVSPSILRLSAPERLAAVAVVIAVLWVLRRVPPRSPDDRKIVPEEQDGAGKQGN